VKWEEEEGEGSHISSPSRSIPPQLNGSSLSLTTGL